MWTTRATQAGAQCADRRWHLEGLHPGFAQRPPDQGVAPHGQWPRESYAHIPMPRMTNTYMSGATDTAEIISRHQEGLCTSNFGGGQVDITWQVRVFCSEAYCR